MGKESIMKMKLRAKMIAEALKAIETIKTNIVESKTKEETKKHLAHLTVARKALVKAKCGAITLVKKVKKAVKKVKKIVKVIKKKAKKVEEKKITKKVVLPPKVTKKNVTVVVKKTITIVKNKIVK